MKIGIDISQLAYGKTGVANYLKGFIEGLLAVDKDNEYILFYSSLRIPVANLDLDLKNAKATIKSFKLPQSVLTVLWNKMHVMPIENFIGDVDLFISSDWTEPPTKKAKKATILYDLIVYKAPDETAASIVSNQKAKLYWTKKECDVILCISKSTKNDAAKILEISEEKLVVAYPGMKL